MDLMQQEKGRREVHRAASRDSKCTTGSSERVKSAPVRSGGKPYVSHSSNSTLPSSCVLLSAPQHARTLTFKWRQGVRSIENVQYRKELRLSIISICSSCRQPDCFLHHSRGQIHLRLSIPSISRKPLPAWHCIQLHSSSLTLMAMLWPHDMGLHLFGAPRQQPCSVGCPSEGCG